MILSLVAAATLAAAPVPDKCPDLVTTPALLCRAIHFQAEGNLADSAKAFEQAALASPDTDRSIARIWAAAGNMWLAVGDYGKAAIALDKALALPDLVGEQRGDALIDRAQVAEAQGDLKTARARLDEAAGNVSDQPYFHYFSAALALREGDVPKAQLAINQALALMPDDASILFEAGHVAQAAGDSEKARDYWQRSARADPGGSIGKAAAEALDLLAQPPKDDASPAKS